MKNSIEKVVEIIEKRMEFCKERKLDNTLNTIISYYEGNIIAYEDVIKILKLEVK